MLLRLNACISPVRMTVMRLCVDSGKQKYIRFRSTFIYPFKRLITIETRLTFTSAYVDNNDF